ncbi:ribonuclease E/G [Halobacillus litoralis]|uniref:ribonuclease E/G n=1 Tax=Halobacillus litoralis TaxID=45668 RepID=UPI001CFDE5AE|nr:ribonuclease E/G [Halobacillus litoralis]
MRKLVIHTKTSEKTGLVLEQGNIQEYVIDRPGVKTLTGSIFWAKVVRIDKGLQAAFVDIGGNQHAFLRKETIPWCKDTIESAVKIGEMIYVQIIKEPVGHKGAQVTADITLPGLYCVYQPFGGEVSVSRKLGSEARENVQVFMKTLLHEQEGAIVRTAAEEAGDSQLKEELILLQETWEMIQRERKKKPAIVWSEPLLPDQFIRKFPVSTIEDIVIDDAQVARDVKRRFPSLSGCIQWDKEVSKHLPVSVSSLQEQLASPKVELENGVELVIEQTEAMTVIDVNSHRFQGGQFSQSQAFKVNQSAAVEIQRQIRLRNLSGIIIIDFINIKDPEKEKQLVSDWRRLLRKDPVQTTVLGMTRLGFLEMTRKREGVSPLYNLTQKQPPVWSVETSVFRLERELMERSHGIHSEAVLVAVHPAVADLKKQLLSSPISSKIPQELFVRKDPDVLDYQIELEGSLDMIREAVQRRGYHVDNLF